MNKNKLFIILSAVALSALVIGVLIWKREAVPPKEPEPVCSLPTGGVHIYDIDEYNAFIEKETNLPDNFVTADMLKEFGSFYGFVCNSETDFSVYFYFLTLENGYESTLRISHSDINDQLTTTAINSEKIGKDMTALSTKDTGNVTVNGIHYHYIKGELLCIRWQENNIYFEMSAQQLSDYPPLSSSSIMGKLISAAPEDQKNALKHFSEITSNKIQTAE